MIQGKIDERVHTFWQVKMKYRFLKRVPHKSPCSQPSGVIETMALSNRVFCDAKCS